jgi:hypothetical protein
MELTDLKPSETITVALSHPETKAAFSAVLAGPYSTTGLVASEMLLDAIGTKESLKPEDDRALSKRVAVTVLRALPDVTVDGVPITVRDAAHAEELCAMLPYLAGQVTSRFLKALGFFSEPSTPSSSTPDISASSAA